MTGEVFETGLFCLAPEPDFLAGPQSFCGFLGPLKQENCTFVFRAVGALLGRGVRVALSIFLYCEMCSMFLCLHVNQGRKLVLVVSECDSG